jgi:hypothetical protein
MREDLEPRRRAGSVHHHNATPESWDLGEQYAWHDREVICGGRLQAAYVRAGTAGRWTRVGSICCRCGTFWRDTAALATVDPYQRRATVVDDAVDSVLAEQTVDDPRSPAVDGMQESA